MSQKNVFSFTLTFEMRQLVSTVQSESAQYSVIKYNHKSHLFIA